MDNLQRIAQNLAKRALENGHDPNYYSPFARSAKRSLGINICGKQITEETKSKDKTQRKIVFFCYSNQQLDSFIREILFSMDEILYLFHLTRKIFPFIYIHDVIDFFSYI